MTPLTFDEIERIGRWKPYRPDWPVDGRQGQKERYGQLISSFNTGDKFDSIQEQNGGLSNFIEFICFQKNSYGQNLEAIVVFISLCAPIAAYGQIHFFRQKESHGLSHPEVGTFGQITSESLHDIETEIKRILAANEVTVLPTPFLDQDLLPGLVIEENLLEGQKLFHYLFQWTD